MVCVLSMRVFVELATPSFSKITLSETPFRGLAVEGPEVARQPDQGVRRGRGRPPYFFGSEGLSAPPKFPLGSAWH